MDVQGPDFTSTIVENETVAESTSHFRPGPTSITDMEYSTHESQIAAPPIVPSPRSLPTSIYDGGTSLLQSSNNLTILTCSESASTPRFLSFQSRLVELEFQQAVDYVGKIKSRFQAQPERYTTFLEILHGYSENQRDLKQGRCPGNFKHLTEQDVYSQVSSLLVNHEDLIQEFGKFLSSAPNPHTSPASPTGMNFKLSTLVPMPAEQIVKVPPTYPLDVQSSTSVTSKRPNLRRPTAAPKKAYIPTITEKGHVLSSAKAGNSRRSSTSEFFNQVQQLLKAPEIQQNFLRCLKIHKDEIWMLSEQLQQVTPLLSTSPYLYERFKAFIGFNENGPVVHESVPAATPKQTISEEQYMEIDFKTCKRLGTSYILLPQNLVTEKCSGKTILCHQVLNDALVSFPTCSDTPVSKIPLWETPLEVKMNEIEEKRLQLDILIETNVSTLRVLQYAVKKMSLMSPQELKEFQLDECLGGSSHTINQRAIRCLYGDKATEIIDGLMKRPNIAVPLVLRRLKAKDHEWREVQKEFNQIWRDQIEKISNTL